MTRLDQLEERLAALERTVAERDFGSETADGPGTPPSVLEDVKGLRDDVDRIEDRLADLEGQLQALSGFATNVESVNEDVERQADVAIAAVDRVEDHLTRLDQRVATIEGGGVELDDPDTDRDETTADAVEAAEPAVADDAVSAESTVDDFVAGTEAEQSAFGDVDEASDWNFGADGEVSPAADEEIHQLFDSGETTSEDDGGSGFLSRLGSKLS